MRTLIVATIVFFSGCLQAHADDVRLERLNIMFEGNESAAAYLRYCYDKPPETARAFRRNAELTAAALAREMMAEFSQMSSEQAVEALMQKQAEFQEPLNRFYEAKGCDTSQAQAARRHFEMFNKYSKAEMKAFLDDIENK